MKNNKQMQELEKIKSQQDLSQQENAGFQAPSQLAPLDQLRQKLDSLQQDIRQQQLNTEASLQDTFSQAAGGLGDCKALAQLHQIANSLGNLVKNQGLQGATSQYHELLSQLDQDLQQQIQSGSQQAMRSLQQGVTALAQANAALLDNQNYQQILHYVHQSRLLLANWEAGGDSNIH